MVGMLGFEFEGNLFLIPCGGLSAGIVLLGISGSFLVAAVPVVLATAYTYFFHIGKPPHYKEDLFEYIEKKITYNGYYGYELVKTKKAHPIEEEREIKVL
jgi:hypothetical protein